MEDNRPICRYSVIRNKNRREIALLRGRGCAWKRCRFCDYHLDMNGDEGKNFALNARVLERVTGEFGRLEVINSGSFVDLDAGTMNLIEEVCTGKGIDELHFECHWMHRGAVPALRARFGAKGVRIRMKIGVETFDGRYREEQLVKGIDTDDPALIARDFDECCLLQGLPGQTAQSMRRDIETGLAHFSRVCVNLMRPCNAPLKPDPQAVRIFTEEVYPRYADNPRVDMLLENTDFGVGGAEPHEQ